MINRIQLILKTKNISPSQFADQIQVQRSGVSHILSGRNNPSLDFILKILKTYPEIDADWLLFGKGQMISKTDAPLKAPAAIPDLFAQPVIEEAPKPEKKKEKYIPPALPFPEESKASSPEEKIEKIVVFYDSNTFKEYKPK
jgi:transcriptional regulator with XRE-family HTH domain